MLKNPAGFLTKFLWLAVVVVLSSFAAADEFTAEFAPAQQAVNEGELAQFNITLFHAYPGVEFFEVYSPDVLWDIRTNDALHIQPKTTFTSVLTIQPMNVNPGLYGIPIHVKRTGTNQVKKALLYLEVTGSPSSLTYLPAIRGTAEIAAFVDPREEIMITTHLENQNRRDLQEIDVKVRSNVINQDFRASLAPLERKSISFLARVDPATPPQQDTLKVSIIATEGDKAFQFDLPTIGYAVKSYGQLVPSMELVEDFLKTTRVITLTNNANVVIAEPYKYPLPWYARIFTRTDPKAARVEEGMLVWDIALNVGNSAQLRVTTNYRPLAIAILVALLVYIVYLVFRSPLLIKKSATVLSTREGGISELKILLELKNRSGKPIHQAHVIDLVPRIAELIKEYEVGTLAPNKVIRHDRKGTIVKYEVGDIMAREERMISYKIKSSLSILGGVSLPEAVSKFVTANGRERTSSSNRPKVSFLG